MSRDPSLDRQYTEKEIRAILQRAGKIQDAKASGENGFRGTTLAQLQQAASELALDPEAIAQAAREVEIEAAVAKSTGLMGRAWRVDYDQILPGAVTEDTWPYIVDEMRAVTGRVGTPKTFGKGYEWLSQDPDPLHITFTPHGPNTRVRLTARFGDWRLPFYILPAIFALLLDIVTCAISSKSGLLTPGLFIGLQLAFPTLTFLGGRIGFGRLCARKRFQTNQLINHVQNVLEQSAHQAIEGGPNVLEVQPARSLESYASSTQPSEEPALVVQNNHGPG